MQLNPSEISDLIKAKIEKFDVTTEAHNEGTVVTVTDGIVRILYDRYKASQPELAGTPAFSK